MLGAYGGWKHIRQVSKRGDLVSLTPAIHILLAPSHADGFRISRASADLSASTVLATGIKTRSCAAGTYA